MADTDYNRRNKVPRPLSELEKERLEEFLDSIHYSARSVPSTYSLRTLHAASTCHYRKADPHRYSDNEYEYRHVQLPKAMLKAIPKEYHDPSKGTLKLLWEEEL